LLVLLGVGQDDNETDVRYTADKLANLRIFSDNEGHMNLSVKDVGGSILLVSQFTLYGDARRGRRPSFSDAARPEAAEALFDLLCAEVAEEGIPVATGSFGEMMMVELVNDGPVTILLESRRAF
jgi:D-tyrosyl-tRNA(Tyr) deacylase